MKKIIAYTFVIIIALSAIAGLTHLGSFCLEIPHYQVLGLEICYFAVMYVIFRVLFWSIEIVVKNEKKKKKKKRRSSDQLGAV